MAQKLLKKVKSSWIAAELGLQLAGSDLEIEAVCPLNQPLSHGLTFSKAVDPLNSASPLVVIGSSTLATDPVSVLISASPRLDFARALNLLETKIGFERGMGPAEIHPSVRIGKNVVIGNGVKIGANTVIHHNVVIADDVSIGENCVIKSGTVIGEAGFGFERDEQGRPIRMPHLGSVIIGNHVELGSLNTVCRGTLGDTRLEDYVKTDDHVHIAHNCRIGFGVLITACAELSGGVEISKGAWIAPNCSIMQKVKIGENAVVGLGAVVLKHVDAGSVVAGSPAKPLEKRAK